MASQTRPFLMTGAALASAAAIVAATPVIAPSIVAAPLAVSQSSVNLTTFADVFTIPTDEWVKAFFQGYGGIVGPNNPQPGNPAEKGGLEPWASQCNATCVVNGPSGVAYLALDALLTGNGLGWDKREDWPVGAVNYFFEGGTFGAGSEWILQSSVGAANPLLAVAITLLYTGPQVLAVVYANAVQLLGDAALNLPILGDYLYGALNAYLGPSSLNPAYQGYTQGLSGVLNYTIDVLLGAAPGPPPAAALAAAPAAAAAALATKAVEAVEATDSASAGGAATIAEVAAPTAVDAVEAASDAAAEKTEATPAETGAAEAPEVAEVAADESVTATEVKSEVGSAADAVADTTEATTPAADSKADSATSTRKRPLRDAVANVTTSIGSALKGTKAGAETAASADEKPADEKPADAAADSAS